MPVFENRVRRVAGRFVSYPVRTLGAMEKQTFSLDAAYDAGIPGEEGCLEDYRSGRRGPAGCSAGAADG